MIASLIQHLHEYVQHKAQSRNDDRANEIPGIFFWHRPASALDGYLQTVPIAI